MGAAKVYVSANNVINYSLNSLIEFENSMAV